MPELSRFFGIIIQMYFTDHNPPHFHAEYQGEEALIEIETGTVLRGGLPRKEMYYVQAWREIHRDELIANWDIAFARSGEVKKIKPLS